MRLIGFTLEALATALAAVAEAPFWIGHGLGEIGKTTIDLAGPLKRLGQGALRCPGGHEIPEVAICTCARCGFCYEGSVYCCANPECGATTPYINCPECGLSQRNPWRVGRP